TVHIDAAVDATDPNFRRALNVQQAARRGFAWARDAAALAAAGAVPAVAAETFSDLEFRWVPGLAATSGYAPATQTTAARATISDAPANPDPYDDDIVLR